MWQIFKPSSRKFNLRWMDVDMHSHILPELDDGSKSVEQSVTLLDELMNLGLTKFYFTPHVFQEVYPNTPARIKHAFEQVDRHIALQGGYAAEYMVDSCFDQQLAQDNVNLLALPGKHVLIEMSYMQESRSIEKNIFELQTLGYKPILAHPERYVFYHRSTESIERMRDLGCLLQLNLLSLTGYYGKNEKQAASRLIEKRLIDLVGTDVHHERHVNVIKRALTTQDLSACLKRCSIKNQALFGHIIPISQP